MRYEICCIDSTCELITALVESGQTIARSTFLRYADRDSLREVERRLGYDTGTERGGLRMAKDWHVGYFRGVYDGRRCVYFTHSAIEFIFTDAPR